MARPRKWTDEQRQAALDLYVVEGPSAVERQLGIPAPTVVKWAKALGLETVSNEITREAVEARKVQTADKREKLKEQWVDLALKATTRASDESTVARDAKDWSIAGSIATEKFELLDNRATARTETNDAVRSDHERDVLRAAIERELAARGEPAVSSTNGTTPGAVRRAKSAG